MKPTEPHASNSRGSPLAVVILAAFGAGVTGGFAAHWMDADTADNSQVPPSSSARDGSAQLAAEVHALTQAIEQFAQRPPVSPDAPNAEPRGVEPLRPESSTASLEAAITRLGDALGRSAGQRPAVADRVSLNLPADPQAARARLDALRTQDINAVKKEHLFRPASEIIELYGLPDDIDVHDRTVDLFYRSSDAKWDQTFKTLDGLVVNYSRSN
jgi:hypothetical protein